MRKISGMLLVLMVVFALPLRAQTDTPVARPQDVSSADAIVAAVYDVISGPAGQKRDWNRFASLFYPGARLVPSIVSRVHSAAARASGLNQSISRPPSAAAS